jgi:L-ascorbate metabolism protein UlaG (beta-lactamase superfamily)
MKWFFITPVLIVVIGALFVFANGYKSFGKNPTGQRLARIKLSPQWHDGKFQNPNPIWMNNKAMMSQMFRNNPDSEPQNPIPVETDIKQKLSVPSQSNLRVTWFGHSSSLVEIDGARILIDPVWGPRASPFSWIGPKRWYKPVIKLDDLKPVDTVLISHDHYDHLDRETIEAMRSWTHTRFVVPLGIGETLEYWGIPSDRITELDWWQSTRIHGIQIVATPARHASGRVISQDNQTLWSGFALLGQKHRLYYSGDSGYFPGFKHIGEALGPFDVALIEAGQYNPAWPDFHLGPEQAVQVNLDVKGKVMIPMHWGLFKLAPHSWTEPVERIALAASCADVSVMFPKPGQSVEPTEHTETPKWWASTRWDTAQTTPIHATQHGDPQQRFTTTLQARCSS